MHTVFIPPKLMGNDQLKRRGRPGVPLLLPVEGIRG